MCKLVRTSFLGYILSALGYPVHEALADKKQIFLKGGNQNAICYGDLKTQPEPLKKFWCSGVRFPLKGGNSIDVLGFPANEVDTFISSAEKLLGDYLYEALEFNHDKLELSKKVLERLDKPIRYPSACLVEPFLKTANELADMVPSEIPEILRQDEEFKEVVEILNFAAEPAMERREAIKSFIQAELEEMREFFDTIEKHPLTPEQRLAILTDEDATLILAGAGSGKTSVIVSKAAYLIQRGIRKPEEILLLAFGKDAATEMEDRIEELVGASIEATTFHALGYNIIAKVEGTAPPLAEHASDEAKLRQLLRKILVEDLAKKKDIARLILKWFSELYWPYKSEWDFETKDEYYQYIEGHELRSLKGDIVKSFEELEIANWLFLNGIKYEYEPVYEHKLPDIGRKAYTPDFKLTESGVYIEHFGVRKNTLSNGEFELRTAPNVNRHDYLEGMRWKREVHEQHGTVLIETYSYERQQGVLLSALKDKIKPYAKPKPIASQTAFDIINELGQVDSFTQTLGTFLKHFKSSGASLEDCKERAKNHSDPARSEAFIEIFEYVYQAYEEALDGLIDFEDMIDLATKHVEARKFKSPFKHILIDEFQDISEGRAKLVKAIKSQHPDARIFAVGDDWQSIYRFAGADIHLMNDFGSEFGGKFDARDDVHEVVDLGRTFRSVDKIALPARRFVLQNPNQILKKVETLVSAEEASIHISYYGHGEKEKALIQTLNTISINSPKGLSVLVLGRYRHVRPKNWRRLTAQFKNLDISFKTVHASKGLEADHVIILDLKSDKMGFPSEIVDDPVLDLVLPKPEQFPHAEERRLFYVALTRAKQSVHLLADQESPSDFVRELAQDEYETDQSQSEAISKHRCSECNGRMIKRTSKAGATFFACEHRRLCGKTVKPCSVCETDIPVGESPLDNTKECTCGAKHPACTQCSDGWLVERKGRYGRFMGCINYPECEGKGKSLKK